MASLFGVPELRKHHGNQRRSSMLRVGERVLLLALSEECDKHPLGYLSSRLLTDAEGMAREER